MTVTQAWVDNANTVKGFITPIWRTDPISGVKQIAGVSPEDGQKIAMGYACANVHCLAEFGVVRLKCPLCGLVRDDLGDYSQFEEPPQEWLDHLRAQRDDSRTAPIAAPTLGPEEFIRQIQADKDIDQIKLRGR